MEDDYRAKSEFFDSLVPNKNLLLALAVAGVCLAVASLAIGTFQSGRNPENKEIRLYAFDRLPTEAAGAVSLLLILLGLGFTGWPLLNLAYRYEQFSPLSLVFSSAAVGDGHRDLPAALLFPGPAAEGSQSLGAEPFAGGDPSGDKGLRCQKSLHSGDLGGNPADPSAFYSAA